MRPITDGDVLKYLAGYVPADIAEYVSKRLEDAREYERKWGELVETTATRIAQSVDAVGPKVDIRQAVGPTDRRPVDHYMQGRWEVIEVIDGMMPKELTPYQGMLWGNVVKYLMRFMHKGKPVDDLHKSTTYTEWLIESLEKGAKP